VAAFLFSILAFAWSATSAQRKSSGVILFTLPASYAGKFVPESLHDANVRGFLLLVGYTINWASVVLLLWVDSGGKLKWVVWGGLPGPPIRFPKSPPLAIESSACSD
jgi:hypothetical protein